MGDDEAALRNPELKDLARCIAETQIDLRRVHKARHQLLSQALSDDPHRESDAMPRTSSALAWPDTVMKEPNSVMEEAPNSKPEGPYMLTAILAEKIPRLLAFNRYERRALSRRKFAIRAFDAARAAADT